MNIPLRSASGVRPLLAKPATRNPDQNGSRIGAALGAKCACAALFGAFFFGAALAQNVTVNCATTLSESGGDDLAKIRGYFDTATWPQRPGPMDRETRWRMEQIRANSFRSIHDEDSSYLSSGTFVPSPEFKKSLDRYKDMGFAKPHIVVGLKKPTHLPLSSSTEPWNWTAAQWNDYEDYCYKLIRHVMLDYRGGWQEVRFEITNEAEVAGNLWNVQPPTNSSGRWDPGHRNLYDGFLKIYREWAQAAQRFANETGRNPRIMGPVTGVGPLRYWPANPWHTWFLDDVTAQGLRLDVFTIHFYGPSDPIGTQPDYYPAAEYRYPFSQMIGAFRTKLNAVGRSTTPIHVTEWGPCDWFDRVPLMKAVNPTPVGGAWTAAMLREMLTRNIDDAVLLYFREPQDETGTEWHNIGPMATYRNNTYAKPSFNVLRMFNALPGTRRPVTTANWHNDLGVIASSSSNQVGVLVHNFNYNASAVQDMTSARNVTISLAGSSLTGTQTVRRYLVDANNGNINKHLLLNQVPPPLHECELKLAETFNVTFAGGAATLPLRSLGQSAVSLWLVGGQAIPEGDLLGDYIVTSASSAKRLDVANSSFLAGAGAVQYRNTGNISQTWTLTDVGNGFYKVINKNSDLALDVQNGAMTNLSPLVQYGYGGSANQLFAIRPADDGFSHKLVASHSGLIVDTGGGTADGLPIIQYKYDGAANHRWFLRSAAEIQVEAETGTVANGALINLSSSASNGRVIGSLHGASASVTLTNVANPNPSGLTKLEIVYSSADATPAQLTVYLNGSPTPSATLPCARTANWDSFTGIVSFKAALSSLNSVKIVGGSGGVNVDYVKLSPTK